MRKFFLVLLSAAVITAVWADASRAAVADNVIRLHVIANSDSDADQAYKLEVRDRVVKLVSELTANATGSEQAEKIIGDNLELIRQAAGDNTRVALSVKKLSIQGLRAFRPACGKL
jgi:stage II sporulation protein R